MDRIKGGVARVVVLDCLRLNYRVYGLRLAASLRIADKSRDVRLRESGGGRAGGIFPGRRNSWSANDPGNTVCFDQRGGNHQHKRGTPGRQTPGGRCCKGRGIVIYFFVFLSGKGTSL